MGAAGQFQLDIFLWGVVEVLDAAHWVGAVKRGAEGSYMQLQDRFCPCNLARLWTICGILAARGLFARIMTLLHLKNQRASNNVVNGNTLTFPAT